MQPSNKFEHILTKDYLQEEYVNKKRSATKIGKEHGINHVTVLKYIRMHGFDVGIRNGQLEPGMVFNRLTTVKKHNVTKNGTVRWECLCECGNTTYVSTVELKRDTSGRSGTISCGCLKFVGKDSKLWTGFEDITGNFFSRVRCCSKRRNILFEISIEDIWNKYIEQNKKCYLSGVDIEFKKTRGTASIDRIDSKKHYFMDNISICHKDINKIKLDYNKDEFINLCKVITEFDGSFKKTNEVPIISVGYLNSLKNSAIRRNKFFQISVEDIQNVYCRQGGACAITGLPIVFGKDYKEIKDGIQTASVDRINNDIGYIPSNIQIVNKKINFSRQSLTIERYKELCKMVMEFNTKIT